MNEKILAKVVVEVVGSPKEHVEMTIRKYIERIEENFKIINHVLYDAEQLKEEKFKGMFSSFVDLEMEFNESKEIVGFCFDYMPSSIDIIKPEKFSLESKEMSDMINDLIAKLHNLDMNVKNLNAQNVLLKREINRLTNKT
jgi:hypothetical protein